MGNLKNPEVGDVFLVKQDCGDTYIQVITGKKHHSRVYETKVIAASFDKSTSLRTIKKYAFKEYNDDTHVSHFTSQFKNKKEILEYILENDKTWDVLHLDNIFVPSEVKVGTNYVSVHVDNNFFEIKTDSKTFKAFQEQYEKYIPITQKLEKIVVPKQSDPSIEKIESKLSEIEAKIDKQLNSISDPRFNEMLRNLYADLGKNLQTKPVDSNEKIADRIAKILNPEFSNSPTIPKDIITDTKNNVEKIVPQPIYHHMTLDQMLESIKSNIKGSKSYKPPVFIDGYYYHTPKRIVEIKNNKIEKIIASENPFDSTDLSKYELKDVCNNLDISETLFAICDDRANWKFIDVEYLTSKYPQLEIVNSIFHDDTLSVNFENSTFRLGKDTVIGKQFITYAKNLKDSLDNETKNLITEHFEIEAKKNEFNFFDMAAFMCLGKLALSSNKPKKMLGPATKALDKTHS